MNKRLLLRRIVAAVILLGFCAQGLSDAARGDWFLLGAVAAGFLLGVVIFTVVFPIKLRRALSVWLSSWSYRPASPEDFAGLNGDELDGLTQGWEELGFRQSGDFVIESGSPQSGNTFSRVLEHAHEGAVVIIEIVRSGSLVKPFSTTIESLWGERERVEAQDRLLQNAHVTSAPLSSPSPVAVLGEAQPMEMWALVTHNRVPNRYFKLLRHPRVLGGRLERGASPESLWAVHQERSALVESRLNSPALRGDLTALVHTHARVLNALSLRRVQCASPWTLLRSRFSRLSPAPVFFDGELAPLQTPELATRNAPSPTQS